ncbi:MAG: adenylate kinase [Acidobacteriota bacterium]|nr:adenylate kinase [Acidobacteriota bacterium]
MAVEARRIVFLGAPGSGKGTQAELLAAALGVPAVSTGDMLRQAVAAGTPLGSRVESILKAGELVDDATMGDVVRARLGQADAAAGFLLDGYPRTIAQADTLDSILEEAGVALDLVLQVRVPEKELVRRALDRRREDDTEEVIGNRLAVYEESTRPLIGLYRGRGLLRPVDGNQPVESVAATILATVEAGV